MQIRRILIRLSFVVVVLAALGGTYFIAFLHGRYDEFMRRAELEILQSVQRYDFLKTRDYDKLRNVIQFETDVAFNQYVIFAGKGFLNDIPSWWRITRRARQDLLPEGLRKAAAISEEFKERQRQELRDMRKKDAAKSKE